MTDTNLKPDRSASGPLAGLKVLDLGSLFAGPLIATNLADLGADVIKIEHPRGDDLRRLGATKNGAPLWWKVAARNKEVVAIDIGTEEGAALVRQLAVASDIVIENFRPGRIAQWGLGYGMLSRENPGLIMVHVSGFGQAGPYRNRPGFGTLAEAFCGFAHVNGHPDGPPTLPAFALADSVAALFGTYSVLAALYARDRNGGEGQEIDINLYEPMLWLMGSMAIDYDQLGVVAQRRGNRSNRSVPRNAYRSKDGHWLVVSCTADSIAVRLFRAIGRPDMAEDPELATNTQRVKRLEEIDGIVAAWVAARPREEALHVFERHEVAAAPINDIADLLSDPHVRALGSLAEVEDPELGRVRMQGIAPRFSRTPGAVRWAGKGEIGADTRNVLLRLGLSPARLSELDQAGVIRL